MRFIKEHKKVTANKGNETVFFSLIGDDFKMPRAKIEKKLKSWMDDDEEVMSRWGLFVCRQTLDEITERWCWWIQLTTICWSHYSICFRLKSIDFVTLLGKRRSDEHRRLITGLFYVICNWKERKIRWKIFEKCDCAIGDGSEGLRGRWMRLEGDVVDWENAEIVRNHWSRTKNQNVLKTSWQECWPKFTENFKSIQNYQYSFHTSH